jgi:hypothetical protein
VRNPQDFSPAKFFPLCAYRQNARPCVAYLFFVRVIDEKCGFENSIFFRSLLISSERSYLGCSLVKARIFCRARDNRDALSPKRTARAKTDFKKQRATLTHDVLFHPQTDDDDDGERFFFFFSFSETSTPSEGDDAFFVIDDNNLYHHHAGGKKKKKKKNEKRKRKSARRATATRRKRRFKSETEILRERDEHHGPERFSGYETWRWVVVHVPERPERGEKSNQGGRAKGIERGHERGVHEGDVRGDGRVVGFVFNHRAATG